MASDSPGGKKPGIPNDDDKTDPGLVVPPEMQRRAVAPRLRPVPSPASLTLTAAEPINAPASAAVRMPELGPIDPLMKDATITEIMVNDTRNVIVERGGKMEASSIQIAGIDELNRLARLILDTTGRVLSPDQPYVDVMMPDGSRVNIVGPPLTLHGPCITIRKFPLRRLSIHDLLREGSLDQRMAYFLNLCVLGRRNILVSGGTGSGKTTLLNALCSFIPKSERIVTIEDTPELALAHLNSVRMQTKPQTPGSPPIPARELVANALRMRPDRVIVGECRRGEALDMLQAMNTGHEGSMTTVHANTPRDSLARVETLCLMSGIEMPLPALRKQMAAAIDLVVQIQRFRDGSRRVTSITEITGMEGETITTQDLFEWDVEAQVFRCTGFVPSFVDSLRRQGIEFPVGFFS